MRTRKLLTSRRNALFTLALMIVFAMSSMPTTAATASTTTYSEYRWVPIGFVIATLYGEGSTSITSSISVSASVGGLKGTTEFTESWELGPVQNGKVTVKLQKYEIQKIVETTCFLIWCWTDTSYKVIPTTEYTTYTLAEETSGASPYYHHYYLPSSVTIQGIPTTTWDIDYDTIDFSNDLRSQPSSYQETYTLGLSNQVELSAEASVYGVDFSFGITISSGIGNAYVMNGGYKHYGDYKGATFMSWSYYHSSGGGGGGVIK